MQGTVVLTGANSSLGISSVQYLLEHYPDYHYLLTVRDASDADVNTAKLCQIIGQYPNAKASIHQVDLSGLSNVDQFVSTVHDGIKQKNHPQLKAIICNAHYWDLIGDPELTVDGYDKTLQISHISHASLVLQLLDSFGTGKGRVVFLSSLAHWAGKSQMEKYPPVILEDTDLLINP